MTIVARTIAVTAIAGGEWRAALVGSVAAITPLILVALLAQRWASLAKTVHCRVVAVFDVRIDDRCAVLTF
jgi:hypothetical protein